MIRSFTLSALILLCTAMVEAAILSNIAFLPAIPDLSLLCVLYFSLRNGRVMGEVTGFFSGILLDFLSACPFGLNCLYRTLLGFLGGLLNRSVNTEGILVPVLTGAGATALKAGLLWIVSILYPSNVLAYSPVSLLFIFEVGCNAILSPVVFKFLGIFSRALTLRPETII